MLNKAISLCQEFVRIPSLSGQETQMMHRVAETMHQLGFDEVRENPSGAVTGVYRGKQTGRPGRAKVLMFDIHTDTVEVTDPESWTYPPFGGEVIDGRLYGRGSCDIKGGLASVIAGISSLSKDEFSGEVWATATTHEEDMEGAVTRQVASQDRPDYCVVVEPTSLQIGWIQKGRGSVVFHTRGIAAHTSTPQVGVNAIYKMLPVIDTIRNMERRQDAILGPEVIELVEVISEPFPGGVTVPTGCHARFDCRLLPGETQESLIDRFREVLPGDASVEIRLAEAFAYTGAHLRQPDFHVGWSLETGHPLIKHARSALRQAGSSGDLYAVPFCSNASALSQLGIPTIILGPGNIEQAHTLDEWVSTSDLGCAAQAFAHLAKNLLNSDDAQAAQ